MKIAYLMNSYPMTSTTFVRREIEAHEAAGVPITRYAVRPWAQEVVDERDIAEKARTHYLFAGNIAGVFQAFLALLVARPLAVLRATGLAAKLWRKARAGLARHGAYLLQAAYLAGRARAEGIEHIHAHFGTNSAAVAMLARVMGGPAFSFTVHGPDEIFDAKWLSFPEKIERAEFVAAISHYTRAQLIRVSSPALASKIRVVRCGVFLDDAPAPPSLAEAFVCVGRLCPQKGQALIPAALARVRREFPNAKVMLVGDGESRAAIENAARENGVENAIEFLGWRSNKEVAELIRQSRALVLPTFAEGLPVVIMEAFAIGRPAISTYIAGIPELVDRNCGWLVPAGDEEGLAAAMLDALHLDAARLAAMAREGRARVEEKHDLRKNAAALRALFAGDRRSQPR